MLFGLFPGVEQLSSGGYYVRFYTKTLPPKPWPRKVAGVFAYITSDESDLFIDSWQELYFLHILPEKRKAKANRARSGSHKEVQQTLKVGQSAGQ